MLLLALLLIRDAMPASAGATLYARCRSPFADEER